MAKRPLDRNAPHDDQPETSKDADDKVNRATEEIKRATGLSDVFARGTIQRAIARAGGNPATMTADEFDRMRPLLKQALANVFPGAGVNRVMDSFSDDLKKRGSGGGQGESGSSAPA